MWTFAVSSHLGGHTRVFLYTCFCTLVALCRRRWAGTRRWVHSDMSAHRNLKTEAIGKPHSQAWPECLKTSTVSMVMDVQVCILMMLGFFEEEKKKTDWERGTWHSSLVSIALKPALKLWSSKNGIQHSPTRQIWAEMKSKTFKFFFNGRVTSVYGTSETWLINKALLDW